MRYSLAIAILLSVALNAVGQDTPRSGNTSSDFERQVESAVKDLTSGDFERREKAQAKLKSFGSKAHPYLAKHRDHSDPEARLRIRNLLDSPRKVAPLKREDGTKVPRARRRSRSDVPQSGVDPFEIFRRYGAGGGIDLKNFKEMERSMEERHRHLEETLREMLEGPSQGFRFPTADSNSNHVRSSISLTTPELGHVQMVREGDKIQLTITSPNGDKKTFNAPNVETFKSQHPAVYDELKGTGIFQQRGFARSWSFSFGGGQPRLPRSSPIRPRRGVTSPIERDSETGKDAAPTQPIPLKRSGERRLAPEATPRAKPKLGATVREHSLKNGVDLLVERVTRGSLADSLGMRPGDVIMRVNGRSVRSMSELQKSVSAAEPKTMWNIWVRRDGAVRILVNKGPSNRPAPSKPKKRLSRDL